MVWFLNKNSKKGLEKYNEWSAIYFEQEEDEFIEEEEELYVEDLISDVENSSGFNRELVQKFTDKKWLIDKMTKSKMYQNFLLNQLVCIWSHYFLFNKLSKFDQNQNVPNFLVKPIGIYLVTSQGEFSLLKNFYKHNNRYLVTQIS